MSGARVRVRTLQQLQDRGEINETERRVLAALRWGVIDAARVERALFGVSAGSPVRSPCEAAAVFGPALSGHTTERLAVAALSRRNELIETEVLTYGSSCATVVDAAQILRWVLARPDAACFIIAHNHPSGDPTPSIEDRAVTERVKQAGATIGIRLHDHVIIGKGGDYRSFVQMGLM